MLQFNNEAQLLSKHPDIIIKPLKDHQYFENKLKDLEKQIEIKRSLIIDRGYLR